MQKTLFGLALVLVLSVSCGGESAPEGGSEVDEAAAPAATEPAEAPAEEPVGEEPVAEEPSEPEITGPVTIVLETEKGAIEFETFPEEAPRTVGRILSLVQRNFYRGQRFHRVVPGFVVQIGDPKSRDMTQQNRWGQPPAGSGTPIGVAEISEKRNHAHGAVAMAHAGDPAMADSQFYITMGAKPQLDGDYTVFGQVTSGLEIVDQIEVGDAIKNMYVKEEAPETESQ